LHFKKHFRESAQGVVASGIRLAKKWPMPEYGEIAPSLRNLGGGKKSVLFTLAGTFVKVRGQRGIRHWLS
jgi:hypothetical protein